MLRTRTYLLSILSSFSYALAQNGETPFQHDPVEYYLGQFLTWVLVVGVLLVLYSLVAYRGRSSSFTPQVLLGIAVIVIPLGALSSGMLLVFERAEKVDFCASCHLTMTPYVEDMRDPESETLTAVHYKNRYIPSNQCYECHTSYGLFGTAEAKMAGMIDVYKYYTRTYELPIRMRNPYANNDCLKCHAEAVRWEILHEDFKDQIFAQEISCMDCHGEQNPAHRSSE